MTQEAIQYLKIRAYWLTNFIGQTSAFPWSQKLLPGHQYYPPSSKLIHTATSAQMLFNFPQAPYIETICITHTKEKYSDSVRTKNPECTFDFTLTPVLAHHDISL